MRLRLLALSGLAFLTASLAARAAETVLTVAYAGKTTAWTADDIAALPHQDITAFDAHDKTTHQYSGLPVHDLLVKAGTPTGEKLRGPGLRLVVVVHTADNYTVCYSLAEFESAFNARTIYLVDQEAGHPMGNGAGPLRFVIPGDGRPARWARMVTAIEVVSVGGGR